MGQALFTCKKKLMYIPFALGVISLSFFVYFSDSTKGPILPCPFNHVTGLYCPGCGITRAFNALFHFEFYQAFRFNALVFIIGPMLAFYLVARMKGKDYKILVTLMLIIAVTYGIFRNISMFSYLAPTVIGN